MWKGYRSVVSLLVCLCFTLSALYLSILHVNATEVSNLFDMLDTVVANYPPTYCNTTDFSANDNKYHQGVDLDAMTYQGTVTVPFVIPISTEKQAIDISKYYCVIITPYTCKMQQFRYDQSPRTYWDLVGLQTSNYKVTDPEGHQIKGGLISNYSNSNISETNVYRYYYFVQGSELLNGAGEDTLPNITVSGYYSFDFGVNNYHSMGMGTSPGYSVTPQISCEIYPVKSQYVKYIKSDTVEDVKGNEILNEQVELQESIKDTTEDTNETTHSIFDSISSFFGSFFDNLLHIFVPEEGYFSDWFDRVNTMLTDKLGILYYPFGKIIEFFNNLNNRLSSQSSYVITFPAIEFTNRATNEVYHFTDAQQINLQNIVQNIPLRNGSANSTLVGTNRFDNLLNIIRTFNSFVLIFGLLSLLRQKINLILRGDNNDN